VVVEQRKCLRLRRYWRCPSSAVVAVVVTEQNVVVAKKRKYSPVGVAEQDGWDG
jgi:hypothetical protein